MTKQKEDLPPRSAKTRILIVDDHEVVVQGIERTFEEEPDFEIAGTARDGALALSMIKSLTPDIVIMDISMPNMDGIEATRQIRASGFQTRIVIYSMYSDEEYVLELFKAGISAYVLKSEHVGDLLSGVKAVRSGSTYFSRPVNEIVQKWMGELSGKKAESEEIEGGTSRLSAREKEIFILLADGLTPRRIADLLHISPKTAESHKYNIMDKLDVQSVAELTKIAIKKALIRL